MTEMRDELWARGCDGNSRTEGILRGLHLREVLVRSGPVDGLRGARQRLCRGAVRSRGIDWWGREFRVVAHCTVAFFCFLPFFARVAPLACGTAMGRSAGGPLVSS